MGWVCPSCWIKNIDDTTIKCICGHLLADSGDPETSGDKVQRPGRINKFIQLALLLIAILGLAAGAIWFPLLALFFDIILFFVPLEKANYEK